MTDPFEQPCAEHGIRLVRCFVCLFDLPEEEPAPMKPPSPGNLKAAVEFSRAQPHADLRPVVRTPHPGAVLIDLNGDGIDDRDQPGVLVRAVLGVAAFFVKLFAPPHTVAHRAVTAIERARDEAERAARGR